MKIGNTPSKKKGIRILRRLCLFPSTEPPRNFTHPTPQNKFHHIIPHPCNFEFLTIRYCETPLQTNLIRSNCVLDLLAQSCGTSTNRCRSAATFTGFTGSNAYPTCLFCFHDFGVDGTEEGPEPRIGCGWSSGFFGR